MGCFLGVTDQWARASRSPHAHEVGAARVDPGALSCTGIRGHSIDGRRTGADPYMTRKNRCFWGLTFQSLSESTSFADKAARKLGNGRSENF
jgi:hypothetical protein